MRENFYFIKAIPTLGTGKVDLTKCKKMVVAIALAGS